MTLGTFLWLWLPWLIGWVAVLRWIGRYTGFLILLIATCVSLTRWRMAGARAQNKTYTAGDVLRCFWTARFDAVEHITSIEFEIRTNFGTWKGIGKWTVPKPKATSIN